LVIANVLPSARSQTNSAPARPISLQKCIELALKENLDLRIERINPLLSWPMLRSLAPLRSELHAFRRAASP
jgi:hypothetical protein